MNADETQPLLGLAEDSNIHVSLETIDDVLVVQSNLVLRNELVTPFIDDVVSGIGPKSLAQKGPCMWCEYCGCTQPDDDSRRLTSPTHFCQEMTDRKEF